MYYSKNSWFSEEFGEEEFELIKKKNLKIIDPKFNIFQIGEKQFYGGRFECLSLEYLQQMLDSLRKNEIIYRKEDYIYGWQINLESKIPEKENFKEAALEKKEIELETDITQEKPINDLPKSPNIKIKSEIKTPSESSPLKKQSQDQSPTKEKENENISGFEKEKKIGLRFQNLANRNVKSLICSPENYGAVFQAASQFNCLEMIGPTVTPEQGITKYIYDDTQGPACALSCRSALFYRNYLVNVNNRIGQSEYNQINTLDDLDKLLENHKKNNYWHIKNGYLLTGNEKAVEQLNQKLEQEPDLQQKMKDKIKVGIHWDTEVNIKKGQNVCQVFCSTLAINYDKSVKHPRELWNPFCPLLLEAQYEATFAVGCILAHMKQERVKVFLTAIGGGVFGNPKLWIASAISKNLEKYKNEPIDVYLVHYSSISDQFKHLGVIKKEN